MRSELLVDSVSLRLAPSGETVERLGAACITATLCDPRIRAGVARLTPADELAAMWAMERFRAAGRRRAVIATLAQFSGRYVVDNPD